MSEETVEAAEEPKEKNWIKNNHYSLLTEVKKNKIKRYTVKSPSHPVHYLSDAPVTDPDPPLGITSSYFYQHLAYFFCI